MNSVDIDAYKEYNKYMDFQNRRLDYVKAIKESIRLAAKYTQNKEGLVVADFCCGTGNNTKLLAEKVGSLAKVLLVDINKGFLDIARQSEIKSNELKFYNEDILNVEFEKECDLVLSVFAYHHVKDSEKHRYIEQIKSCLKDGGFLILTEIFLENRQKCINYYEKLFSAIPVQDRIPGLENFLMQTALSNDFEFKIGKKVADAQFRNAGFKLVEETKIWPLDNAMKKDEGTFVQVYKF